MTNPTDNSRPLEIRKIPTRQSGGDVVITYHSRGDEARTVVAAIEAEGRKAVALQLDSSAVATFDRFARTERKVPGNRR